MQDKLYSYYSWYENSGSQHSDSAPVNSAESIDIPSVSTYEGIPVNLRAGLSSAVAPIIGNSDRPPTAPPGVAENLGYVAYASFHQAALGRAPPLPPASCDYSSDAHLRPWQSATGVETAHAPQTAWNERRAALTQLDRSQVPPETTHPDVFGKSWSQCGDSGQAVVEAPAQPASQHDARHPPYPMPAWSYMPAFPEDSARSISQAHITGLGNVSSWMAGPVLGHVPSLYNHHRRPRKPHARLEHVICDKCEKPMLRQSLRRHIKEVHNHIKRSHTKSSFAAGP